MKTVIVFRVARIAASTANTRLESGAPERIRTEPVVLVVVVVVVAVVEPVVVEVVEAEEETVVTGSVSLA